MIKVKERIPLIISAISVLFTFFFAYNYMKFDILSGHALWHPFSNMDVLLSQGRYVSMAFLCLFYKVLPLVFPEWNLNDIQSSLIAVFKVIIVLLETFLFTKFFYLFCEKIKGVFIDKKFPLVYLSSFFLLFNNYGLQNFKFILSSDIAYFLDYSLSFLFLQIYIYILALLWFKFQMPTRKFFGFSSFVVFLLGISHEYCAVIAFILSFLLLTYLSIKIYIQKNVEDIHQFKFILFMFLVLCISMSIFFFVSNYSGFTSVGGGHEINWKEQFSLVSSNFSYFFHSVINNFVFPYKELIILISFLILLLLFIQKKYASKFFVLFFSIIIGFVSLNFIFLFIGKTNANGDFFIAHQPVMYLNFQTLNLIAIILLSYFLNCLSVIKPIKFVLIVKIICFTMVCFILNKYVGVSYFYKYFNDINISKTQREIRYVIDKYAKWQFMNLDVVVLPIEYYDSSHIQFYNGLLNSENKMTKIYNDEISNGISRLFIQDENYNEEHHVFYDNKLFDYFFNVYKIKPKCLIYVSDDIIQIHPLFSNFALSDKEKNKLKFSDIKVKKLNLDEINKLLKMSNNNLTSSFLYLMKAKYYQINKFEDMVLPALDDAALLDKELYFSKYLRGIYYREKGIKNRAEKDLLEVAKLYENSILLQELLIKLMLENGDINGALDIYSNLVDVFPWGSSFGEKDLYFRRAELFIDKFNDYDSALEDFKKSKEINEHSFRFDVDEQITECEKMLENIN